MGTGRRTLLVYGLLALVWAVVILWQAQEHRRVMTLGQATLRNRSKDIANTLGSLVRGLEFRGAVFGNRLQPVLDDLVGGTGADAPAERPPVEVLSVVLLNAAGEPLASAGAPLDLAESEILAKGERWGNRVFEIVHPIQGVRVDREGATNAPVLLPPFTNTIREPRFNRWDGRGPPPPPGGAGPPRDDEPGQETQRDADPDRRGFPPPGPPGRMGTNEAGFTRGFGPGEGRPRRPFWARGMDDATYVSMVEKRELHGLVLAMSTATVDAVNQRDFWARCAIGFFATLSALGAALAWRNLAKTSDLQLRLVRASEMNTHLKGMSVAAAGLAHEIRNPLNIIRGLAQLISGQPAASAEARERSSQIVQETDKVAAQLNEFINYSRPREVRRTTLALTSVVSDVARTLQYDLEEKKVTLETAGENLSVEADEQLLRQALFNLLINAVQAVEPGGTIRIAAFRQSSTEARLEVRDNGPGIAPEYRMEVFKPYFTTNKRGTGLGLAVVQQIVLAHGWEIDCQPNTPKGAAFIISHLRLAP